jgi:hypothetical protein
VFGLVTCQVATNATASMHRRRWEVARRCPMVARGVVVRGLVWRVMAVISVRDAQVRCWGGVHDCSPEVEGSPRHNGRDCCSTSRCEPGCASPTSRQPPPGLCCELPPAAQRAPGHSGGAGARPVSGEQVEAPASESAVSATNATEMPARPQAVTTGPRWRVGPKARRVDLCTAPRERRPGRLEEGPWSLPGCRDVRESGE